MYLNLFDSHVHSDNSPDGAHSVTFLVETAVERGIQGIALTDHCECDCLEQDQYVARQRQAALDVAMAKTAFRGRVILTTGVELGQAHFDFDAARRVLGLLRYDFVLTSLHRLRNMEELFVLDFAEMSPGELHQLTLQYFVELLEIVTEGDYDAVAHLTFPMRYPKLRAGIDVDMTRYREPIDAVLKVLVDRGKALEVNTSGLRNALGDTMPPLWVVERYRELGGQLVTIGSDAHTVDDLGSGISDAMEGLKQAGFDYFAFYRERKPILLRII